MPFFVRYNRAGRAKGGGAETQWHQTSAFATAMFLIFMFAVVSTPKGVTNSSYSKVLAIFAPSSTPDFILRALCSDTCRYSSVTVSTTSKI